MMVTRWSLVLTDYAEVVTPSPDGSLVALGSLGGDAVVADTRTGEISAKLADHPMGALAAAWSPDGRKLAIGGQDGMLRIYHQDATETAAVQLSGWVASMAWSPGGLLAVGVGRSLLVVDGQGTVIRREADQPSTVTDVAWSADGRRVGAAAYGGVRWYEPESEGHEPVRTMSWKGSILALAMSPTGKWACGGAQDATVHIWRLWSGSELSMSGYPSKIEHLGFRHDGRWLAVGCLGELTVWEFAGRGPSGTRPANGEAHDRHISSLAWEPGADRLATGGADGQVVVWPSPTKRGRPLRPKTVHELASPVAAVAWSGTGGPLVVGQTSGTIQCLEQSEENQ